MSTIPPSDLDGTEPSQLSPHHSQDEDDLEYILESLAAQVDSTKQPSSSSSGMAIALTAAELSALSTEKSLEASIAGSIQTILPATSSSSSPNSFPQSYDTGAVFLKSLLDSFYLRKLQSDAAQKLAEEKRASGVGVDESATTVIEGEEEEEEDSFANYSLINQQQETADKKPLSQCASFTSFSASQVEQIKAISPQTPPCNPQEEQRVPPPPAVAETATAAIAFASRMPKEPHELLNKNYPTLSDTSSSSSLLKQQNKQSHTKGGKVTSEQASVSTSSAAQTKISECCHVKRIHRGGKCCQILITLFLFTLIAGCVWFTDLKSNESQALRASIEERKLDINFLHERTKELKEDIVRLTKKNAMLLRLAEKVVEEEKRNCDFFDVLSIFTSTINSKREKNLRELCHQYYKFEELEQQVNPEAYNQHQQQQQSQHTFQRGDSTQDQQSTPDVPQFSLEETIEGLSQKFTGFFGNFVDSVNAKFNELIDTVSTTAATTSSSESSSATNDKEEL